MYSFSIDRGGTFCDIFCELPDKSTIETKLLSVDPTNYDDAPTEGIRRILRSHEPASSDLYQPRALVDGRKIKSIRMGTTVATNALLERHGDRCGLLITKGFRNLLEIGNQSRPNIFDLKTEKNHQLYEAVFEIDERVMLHSSSTSSSDNNDFISDNRQEIIPTTTGEKVQVLLPLDKDSARKSLETMFKSGIKSVAICLIHSYLYPTHELEIGEMAKDIGFEQISLSHQVMKMQKMVPRGSTSVASAYLTPTIQRYLTSFQKGFVQGSLENCDLLFMRSDGGLTTFSDFGGHEAILSGPAGGVVGYAKTAFRSSPSISAPLPVIGFDMGGTSTDVSRYGGSLEHVFEATIADIQMATCQLDINTVAAGGGSKLFFKNGLFVVGPESSGAHPGPVCYRKGGYLSVTDANVVLGRVIPKFFPKIFGATEDQPLDRKGAEDAFRRLITKNSIESSIESFAYGFVKVANEAMCRPIRNLTQMKGFDLSKHILSAFGGAGPQHCCQIAKNLGIRKIMIHRHGGILSAYGLSLADLVSEATTPKAYVFDKLLKNRPDIDLLSDFDSLVEEAKAKLKINLSTVIKVEYFMNLRYRGTDNALMTSLTPTGAKSDGTLEFWSSFGDSFETNYKREFGFSLDREIVADDLRVRCSIEGENLDDLKPVASLPPPTPMAVEKAYFENGWEEANVYGIENLLPGHVVHGPSIIIQPISTIVLEIGCVATTTADGDIEIAVGELSTLNELNSTPTLPTSIEPVKNDPVQLSIFSHRFMSIAEQMGKTLARTSVSVNIKERLDFSCALFSSSGDLVANAPHIPVHLGAMQAAVKFQTTHWSKHDEIKEGDVLVSNHPQLAGGSHLPDITVITPVFHEKRIVFFVANRGHHSDIGGITPGSMPPFSKKLSEEGAMIVAFKLVREGVFQEQGILEIVKESRNLSDTMSDLRAQVAANRTGIKLVQELIHEYDLITVQSYMTFIQDNAEFAVREMLKKVAFQKKAALRKNGSDTNDSSSNNDVTFVASDKMDDGTEICVKITVDSESGDAVFDFSGTGCQVLGNTNAPPAVTKSATIYCLRCLVDEDIPLNQGCLNCVSFIIPSNSLLDPSPEAAVVGGNVLTSQRVTDVILKAFDACAASSGCMNNLTFGNESFGYYETICGGSGAGNGWNGRAVHTHMTNTRITDPEILERRYPVLLRVFSTRDGSGGKGMYCGGDGVVRELMPLVNMTMSILSERRVLQPYGSRGGGGGKCGVNTIFKREEEIEVNIGGKASCSMSAGDILRIETPGGGGWGLAGENVDSDGDIGGKIGYKNHRSTVMDADSSGSKYISGQGSLGEFNAQNCGA